MWSKVVLLVRRKIQWLPLFFITLLLAETGSSQESSIESVQQWQQLILKARYWPEAEKISSVNQFFNQFPYQSDISHWHQEDYWATPVELLLTQGGDCEDFAIAKYFTLLIMGVPLEKIRIIYAYTNGQAQAHVVLSYAQADKTIILDNASAAMLPLSERSDLIPFYSFNDQGIWLRHTAAKVGEIKNLATWQNVSQRLQQQLDTQGIDFLLAASQQVSLN